MIAVYLAIAAGVWGHPACGPPVIVFVPNPRFAASTFVAECRIEIDPPSWKMMDEQQQCSLILHESGHLHLNPHRERGIMRAIVPPDTRCAPRKIVAAIERRFTIGPRVPLTRRLGL